MERLEHIGRAVERLEHVSRGGRESLMGKARNDKSKTRPYTGTTPD
ncbi:hypothetical protein [Coleofasciculus sp.]